MTMGDFAIWPPHEAFYIQSLLFNTRSALTSAERISNHLQNAVVDQAAAQESLPRHIILDDLQNIVQRGSAISRFLWPSGNPPKAIHKKRGDFLRSTLVVSDQSPIKNRSLRNALVHFDERLDKYLRHHPVGHIIPEYVGFLPEEQDVPLHFFRAYYVDTGEFEILGDRFVIQPLTNEICRLHELLVECDKQGCRLPRPDESTEV